MAFGGINFNASLPTIRQRNKEETPKRIHQVDTVVLNCVQIGSKRGEMQCTSIAESPVVRVVQDGKPARKSKLDGGHEECR